MQTFPVANEPAMAEFGAALAMSLAATSAPHRTDKHIAANVIGLTGDLGVGKTTLARSIIRTLCGQNIEVPSPTYTLVQTYEAENFDIWHCDMYRLDHPDEILELGLLDAFDDALCLVEWPGKLGSYWPESAAMINIRFDDARRQITTTGLGLKL